MPLITKYRMMNEDGSWIETLSLQQAENHGNYIVVEEEITIIDDNYEE